MSMCTIYRINCVQSLNRIAYPLCCCSYSWLKTSVLWTSSKQKEVCVGGSRSVAAKSGAAAVATLKEKWANKKKKIK